MLRNLTNSLSCCLLYPSLYLPEWILLLVLFVIRVQNVHRGNFIPPCIFPIQVDETIPYFQISKTFPHNSHLRGSLRPSALAMTRNVSIKCRVAMTLSRPISLTQNNNAVMQLNPKDVMLSCSLACKPSCCP